MKKHADIEDAVKAVQSEANVKLPTLLSAKFRVLFFIVMNEMALFALYIKLCSKRLNRESIKGGKRTCYEKIRPFSKKLTRPLSAQTVLFDFFLKCTCFVFFTFR